MKPEPMGADSYARVGISHTWKVGFEEAARIMAPLEGKNVLDYGSGTGRSSAFLKELGAQVIGIDISLDMVKKARNMHPGIEFRPLSADGSIPVEDASFDCVFSSFVHVVISQYKEMERMEREIHRILKPGAPYVILTANPKMWGKKYRSFFSILPEGFKGRSGDRIYAQLNETPPVDGYDYLWFEKDHISCLKSAGFQGFETTRPKPIDDLSDTPPFMVIKANKQ